MNSAKIIDGITKSVDQKALVDMVQKMLYHFHDHNFLNIDTNNNIQFGFNTEKLKINVKNEWLLTNTVFCDQPAFQVKSLTEQNLKNTFERVKNLVGAVPFSLVEIDHSDMKEEITSVSETTNAIDSIKNLFSNFNGVKLRNQTVCSPATAVEFFHNQQRDRKIWWRKFSSLPGRFHLTKISSDENDKSQTIEVQAEFPWGLETVEVIKYLPEMIPKDSFYEMKSQRKKFIPQVVKCETSLEKIALTYLCDSYEGINEETDREMLRFSRKLAPYKVAFAASGNTSETVQNLKELALLLAKKIRKYGITTLLLPDVCSTSIERQFLRNDAIGVPYTILLNEKTLKDGIIAIRSRDTTLKEQSHVSLVVSYVEKLMKNY